MNYDSKLKCLIRYILSRRVYDFDRKEFHFPCQSTMKELRSGIIQGLEIDEKLLGTDFQGLAASIAPYMKHNQIKKGGAKGFLQVDAVALNP